MEPVDTVLRESDRLHERAVEFARASVEGRARESFDSLAVDIARFQSRTIPGFSRLVRARGSSLSTVETVPGVPVDAFRIARIAAHPPALDALCFETSGTTGGAPGRHPLRVTSTYSELSVLSGRRALLGGDSAPRVVVALAPYPGERPTSSLGFMMQRFMTVFDGRGLSGSDAPFDADARARWLFGAAPDVAGLRRATDVARERNEPLLVLATAFALVQLLDLIGTECLAAPEGTVVMPTGGFKGRTREIDEAELAVRVAQTFGIPETHVVGEYGMTELTSQLYEGVLPGASPSGQRGVYFPPPWLSVTPVDPATLEPVAEGRIGIARFVDLGNIDFPVAIVTDDQVSKAGPGVLLHGRRKGAPARGCSLAIEDTVLGGSGGSSIRGSRCR